MFTPLKYQRIYALVRRVGKYWHKEIWSLKIFALRAMAAGHSALRRKIFIGQMILCQHLPTLLTSV